MSDQERRDMRQPIRIIVEEPLTVEIRQPRTTRERVLAYSASVIAIAALCTAFWQGYQSRTHSRLSVQPHLVIDGYWSNDADPRGMRLTNNGVGPAFIKSVSVMLDDSLLGGMDVGTWDRFLIATDVIDFDTTAGNLNSTSVLSAGEIRSLVHLTHENKSDRALSNRLQSATERLTIIICYCSVYNKCWQVTWSPTGDSNIEVCECP